MRGTTSRERGRNGASDSSSSRGTSKIRTVADEGLEDGLRRRNAANSAAVPRMKRNATNAHPPRREDMRDLPRAGEKLEESTQVEGEVKAARILKRVDVRVE